MTLSSILQSLNNGLADINRSIARASALQAATSELKQQIFKERHTIESALDLAQSQISLDEKLKDPRFRAAYERASAALADHRQEARDAQPPSKTPPPTFTRSQKHPDVDIEAAIQRSFEALQEERDVFLHAVRLQLSGSPDLRRHFLASLEKLAGRHYLASVDPASSWN